MVKQKQSGKCQTIKNCLQLLQGGLFLLSPSLSLDSPRPVFHNCSPLFFGNGPHFLCFHLLPLPFPGLLVLPKQTVLSSLPFTQLASCFLRRQALASLCSAKEVQSSWLLDSTKFHLLCLALQTWDLIEVLGFGFVVFFFI